MLYIFCNDFLSAFRFFLQMFQMHVSNVSSVFNRTLQMFHLDVLKVHWALHMLQRCRWLATTFPLSVNSLAGAMALSWVITSSSSAPASQDDAVKGDGGATS
jgi:hypothetical protein